MAADMTPEELAIARGDVLKDDAPPVETPVEEEPVKDSLSEDDETPEEKAEREAAEAEAEKKRKARIPLSRHEEILNKAREREEALNTRIKELEGKSHTAIQRTELKQLTDKVEELTDKYEELIFEGKRDEAKAVRRELDKARDDLYETRTSAKTSAARAQAVDELKFDAALANVEASHPELNPESDKFDKDKEGEVVVLLEAFVARGFTRAAALTKAVKYVMGDPSTKGGSETADTLRKQRAEEARRKVADATGRQPPSTAGVGKDNDKGGTGGKDSIDVMKLTQADFAKLDEQALARLRGDVVA